MPYWNLEEEIAKVIEKRGYPGGMFTIQKLRGLIKINKDKVVQQEDMGTLRTNPNDALVNIWDLEEEVTKVIEVGTELGFDFTGREVELGEQIVAREKEENERLAAEKTK